MPDSISRQEFNRFESNINEKIDRILDGQTAFMEQQSEVNRKFNEHIIRDECADNERDTIVTNMVERLDRHREKIKANKAKIAEHEPVVESVKEVNAKISKLSMGFLLAICIAAGGGAYNAVTAKPTSEAKK